MSFPFRFVGFVLWFGHLQRPNPRQEFSPWSVIVTVTEGRTFISVFWLEWLRPGGDWINVGVVMQRAAMEHTQRFTLTPLAMWCFVLLGDLASKTARPTEPRDPAHPGPWVMPWPVVQVSIVIDLGPACLSFNPSSWITNGHFPTVSLCALCAACFAVSLPLLRLHAYGIWIHFKGPIPNTLTFWGPKW